MTDSPAKYFWTLKQAFAAFAVLLASSLIWSCGEVPKEADSNNIVPFNNPRAIAEEPGGNFIVADFSTGHLFRLDGKSGERFLLSDNRDPDQGIRFSQPAGAVVLPSGRIFIADLALNAVIEVDPKSGARSLFAGGSDNSIRQPFGITFARLGGKPTLIVADTGSLEGGGVIGPVLVDLDTGTVTHIPVLEKNTVLYNDPRSVAFLESSQKILVGNFGVGTIVEVDPATGERRMISKGGPNPVGLGPPFISVTDIALSTDGKSVIVADLGREAVIEVNLQTGDRRIITQSFGEIVGSGFDFRVPHGISVNAGGFMITDFGLPGVVRVTADGTRTVFSATPVKGFGQIRGIHVLRDGNIVVADFAGERVMLVDPASGERKLISGDKRGQGPAFNGPVSVDELGTGSLVVADFSYQAIFIVDPVSGDRTFLSGPGVDGRGTGPAVGSRGIALDPSDPGRLLATDFALDAIISVDIETGDRVIFSAAGTGTPRGAGPGFNNPFGIDVGPDGTVYASDMGLQAVFRVDPDGNRTIISSNDGRGLGPRFASPWGIRMIDGELLVADGKGIFRIDQATGDRELVSPGGPIFTMRKLGADRIAISSIGAVNGIEVSDKAFKREILSNADKP